MVYIHISLSLENGAGRIVGGQQNFGTDHTAFMGVVAVLAVEFAVVFFAGTISDYGNGRLSGAALDLGDMKMK